MNKVQFIALLGICLLMVECKRESTKWSPEFAFPIAEGELSIYDVPENENIDTSGDLIMAHFQETFEPISLNNLVNLGDTVIEQVYSADIGIGPISFANGQNIFDLDQSFQFQLDGAELRYAKVNSGFLSISFESDADGYLDLGFNLPGISLDGAPLNILGQTEPAIGENFTSTVTVDISGYELDLTGEFGDERNSIFGSLNVSTSDAPVYDAQIYGSDQVIVQIELLDVQFDEVRGFFGEIEERFSESISIDLPIYQEGFVGVDNVSLSAEIKNYIGVDARVNLDTLAALNLVEFVKVNLENSDLIGSQNFTRAIETADNVIPSSKTISINSDNSNLTEFLGVTPTELRFAGSVELNPLGDVSGGNDFYIDSFPLEVGLDVMVPLCIAMDSLTLRDTLDLEINETVNDVSKLVLKFNYENDFQLGGEVQLFLPFQWEPFALFDLTPAPTADEAYIGLTEIELTGDQLNTLLNSRFITAIARFSTSDAEHVKILTENKLKLLITAVATYEARFKLLIICLSFSAYGQNIDWMNEKTDTLNNTFELNSELDFGSTEVENHFFQKAILGGRMDRQRLTEMAEVMSASNPAGLYSQSRIRYKAVSDSVNLGENTSLFLEFGTVTSVDASVHKDFFHLLFLGNADRLGETLNLGPSSLNSTRFQYAGIGIMNEKRGCYASLNVVNIQSHLNLNLENTSLYTGELAETITLNYQGSFQRTDTLRGNFLNNSGTGALFNGRYNLPLRNDQDLFSFEIRNLGFAVLNKSTQTYSADSSYTLNPISINSLIEDGAVFENGVNFEDSVSYKEEFKRDVIFLPAQFSARYLNKINPSDYIQFSLNKYALASHRAEIGVDYIHQEKSNLKYSLGMSYGGFNQNLRVRMGAQLIYKNWTISAHSTHAVGVFLNSAKGFNASIGIVRKLYSN